MSKKTHKAPHELPKYLKKFIVDQDYQRYTSREQATWRFIMRHSRPFFQKNAHAIYLEGLEKTGIPIDQIPMIQRMDEVLKEFGWGAVGVRGFIPPLAFLDFQSRKLLPIACDMRTLEHIAYTPAPDIVHEAAGHAPILADKNYRDYLTLYANMARKAIFSDEDLRLYEAIRKLSDIKENPDSTEKDLQKAQEELVTAEKSITWTTEASRIARFYWWTAEYGLIGSLDTPKIYGAGLLSSLGESESCLMPKTKKIPLTLACTKQGYDITEPQPQLFVAPSFTDLNKLLRELEGEMAFVRGGVYGLEQGKKANTITTCVFDNELEISGIIENFTVKGTDVAEIRWKAPIQLSHQGKQIIGHGAHCYPKGLTALLTKETSNSTPFSTKDAAFVVHSTKITSVYGGPADFDHFPEHFFGQASSTPTRQTPYSAKEIKLFILYQKLRDFRNNQNKKPDLAMISEEMQSNYPDEWLLALEIIEVCEKNSPIITDLVTHLKKNPKTQDNHYVKKTLEELF